MTKRNTNERSQEQTRPLFHVQVMVQKYCQNCIALLMGVVLQKIVYQKLDYVLQMSGPSIPLRPGETLVKISVSIEMIVHHKMINNVI